MLDIQRFLEEVLLLVDSQNLRVTLRQSGKGAIICGVCCYFGSVLGGRLGVALGGAVG